MAEPEIVVHNKSTVRMNGKQVSAADRAEFLIRNNYPVPTTDLEELTKLIEKSMNDAKEEEKPLGSEKLPEQMYKQKGVSNE